ncbi:variable large family protein, partial [Borreliella burgdorferi]|uniref:variable large family protein n=1 Tax=Borreliella burgdorferi TaxID=139 RepID=UPI003EC13434
KGIVTAAEKAGKEGKLESEEVAGAGEANADAGKLFAKKKANDGGGDAAAAEKAGKEGKLESEEVAGAGDGNEDAGKLFAKKKNDAANGGGDAAAAEKAAAAVSAVSGKQILKAIVDAAEKAGAGVEDVKDAKNPIDAAIGSTDEQNAAAFDKMKKNDQIAAAIVLRGMAKDGEFALKNDDADNAEKGLKSTVESAVNKTVSGWLEEMVKAAKDAATAASGGKDEMIGKVVKVAGGAAAAKGGEEKSVNGIAGGIKGIVAAAEKAGEEGKLKSEAAGEANADAGKLFAKKANDDNGGGDAAAAEKAAAAVSAVSGKQILKAIVDAAGKAGEKKGVDDVKEATNPIDAAIGSTKDNKTAAAFNKMKKNDQIAAAIVLRGMAKDGEFALK